MAGTLAIIGFGFIGERLARTAAERGWSVAALDTRELDVADIRFVRGLADDADALDDVLAGADLVVYAAGTTKPAESDADPLGHTTANLAPVLATLTAARRNGVGHVTFLSSGGTVYGPTAPVPTREDTPLWPINSYGIIKAAAEQYVAMHARQGGFSADILRCANVYGPGEPQHGSQGLIGVARAHLTAREPITVFGDGSARRDFLHVDDLCDVLLRLHERAHGVRVLNVGSGRSTSVMEVITALSASLGVEPHFDRRPARASDVPTAELDISRLREIVDFSPRDTATWLARPLPMAPKDS